MKKIIALIVGITITFSFVPSAEAAEVGGYIDSIDYSNYRIDNNIIGWAYDPRNPSGPVEIEIQIDGEYVETYPVNWPRPDVGQAMGIGDNQGFLYPVDDVYFDGEEHMVRIYSVSLTTGGKTELGGSPFMFSKYDPGVTGYVDEAIQLEQDGSYWIKGWAFDNRDNDINVPIIVYKQYYSTGEVIGFGQADTIRTDVGDAYDVGDQHGFSIEIDSSQKKYYSLVSVYAIDSSVGELKLLGQLSMDW